MLSFPFVVEIIILGLSAGILGGSLGISSAPILVPLLVVLQITKDYRTAIGTTLLTIIPPLSIFALREYYKHGEVNLVVAIILMAAVTFGSYIGGMITTTSGISDKQIALLTSLLLASLSIFWFVMAMTGFKVDIRKIHSFLPSLAF